VWDKLKVVKLVYRMVLEVDHCDKDHVVVFVVQGTQK
jgi:hypothetical protein